MGSGLSAKMTWKTAGSNYLKPVLNYIESYCCGIKSCLAPTMSNKAESGLGWQQQGRSTNSKQWQEGCHFGRGESSRSIFLGVHVLRGWRKSWLLTSEILRADLCLGSCDLLPWAFQPRTRPASWLPCSLWIHLGWSVACLVTSFKSSARKVGVPLP